jgi:branched-chain amino acid aminotransferase
MALEFLRKPHDEPLAAARRAEILADPGFGQVFTDHMALATWTAADGWHNATVQPYGPLSLAPATAALHYAQEIFEGLRAYRHPGGGIWSFRPENNARRFARSAERMALPVLPTENFMASITALVDADQEWVPAVDGGEMSLYLRPFMFASESFLGVRPAREVTYCVIASPVGPYFPGGVQPVSIWVSQDFTRAAPGGTGAAKCGGNYAAGLAAQVQATEHGCEQVCYLDALEHRWVEELGGMNLFFVYRDGSVVTPPTSGTILEGVTRESVLELLRAAGHRVTEAPVDIDDWRRDAASGELAEVFACGTAAVITPVGRLVWPSGDPSNSSASPGTGEVTIGGQQLGPVTAATRSQLVDLQYGCAPDERGWLHRLVA